MQARLEQLQGAWKLGDDAALIGQGAEARLWKINFLGKPCIVKERFKKSYRHPLLDDKITNRRTRSEARCLMRCRSIGVNVPSLYFVDVACARIFMAHIDAPSAKVFLDSENTSDDDISDFCTQLGISIARLHDAGIVHGDLTTSNVLRRACGQLVFIDFGLSFASEVIEDHAVDLYVLERAIINAHPRRAHVLGTIITAYMAASSRADRVSSRLDQVRRRGRKRSMVG